MFGYCAISLINSYKSTLHFAWVVKWAQSSFKCIWTMSSARSILSDKWELFHMLSIMYFDWPPINQAPRNGKSERREHPGKNLWCKKGQSKAWRGFGAKKQHASVYQKSSKHGKPSRLHFPSTVQWPCDSHSNFSAMVTWYGWGGYEEVNRSTFFYVN